MAKNADLGSAISDFLGLGPNNILGIDIGLNSIKMCELTGSKKKYKINKFINLKMPEGAFIEDEIQKHDEIVEVIKHGLEKIKPKSNAVGIALFGTNTIVKRMQIPVTDEEDVEDQVHWEAEQYIPFGIDDTTLDHYIVGENSGGGTDVLVGAARNDIIESFKILTEDAGVKVKIIDLQIFSLMNAFEFMLDNLIPENTYALIDFGAAKTNLLVIQGNSLMFSKEIQIGGSVVTEEIQKEMNLSFVEAEDLKKNGDEAGNLPAEIVSVIEKITETFISEINKSLNFFMTSTSTESIDKCFVTGGNSLLYGLKDTLQNTIGVEVKHFNPLDGIDFNKNFKERELDQIARLGSVAIGLAMRTLKK